MGLLKTNVARTKKQNEVANKAVFWFWHKRGGGAGGGSGRNNLLAGRAGAVITTAVHFGVSSQPRVSTAASLIGCKTYSRAVRDIDVSNQARTAHNVGSPTYPCPHASRFGYI